MRLWDLERLQLVKSIPVSTKGEEAAVSVSSRQKWLAYRADKDVVVTEIATGKKRSIKVEARDFDLSADETRLATIDGKGLVRIHRLSDLSVEKEINKKDWFGVKFAANDRHIMLRGRRKIQIHSLVTDKHQEIGRSGSGGLHANYLSPDFLILANRYHLGGRFEIFDTRDGRLDSLYKLTAHEFESISLSPDGTRIAAGEGQVLRIIDARAGSTIKELRGHLGDVVRSAFSSDGSPLVLASVDGSAKLWDVATGAKSRPSSSARGLNGWR